LYNEAKTLINRRKKRETGKMKMRRNRRRDEEK
jgi:hypothetical protein